MCNHLSFIISNVDLIVIPVAQRLSSSNSHHSCEGYQNDHHNGARCRALAVCTLQRGADQVRQSTE